MKKLIPGLIISFVSGFMFFLYEPITMYATNKDDFWFDIYIVLLPTVLLFLTYVFCVFLVFLFIYFLNKKFFKNKKIYETFLTICFCLLISFYIQGNFFVGGLPSLDGSDINWNDYAFDSIISAFIFLIPLIIGIVVLKKVEFQKIAKIISFVTIAICIMISTSLISTAMTNDITTKKERNLIPTRKDINTVSENKNFYIILLDAVDSRTFYDTLQKSDNIHVFDDFTYYPDTMAGYPFTRDAIPHILSGVWNENKTDFSDYYSNAMDKSPLIDKLIEEDYKINLYDDDIEWNTDKALMVENMYNNLGIKNIVYYKSIIKYVAFKYLPFFLKKYSFIETMNFDDCKAENEFENYTWGNIKYYNEVKENDKLQKIKDNYFSYVHLEGGHVGFNMDKDLNPIEGGTYEQKLEACITLVSRFIDRLKQNNSYDNSVIVVLADHGYNYSEYEGRQNPILFIKGYNEKHDLSISDIPVSFADLQGAFIKLINGDNSQELFNDLDINRKRRYMFYIYSDEDEMIEYEQSGKAYDLDTLKPTGRKFNR